MDIPLADELEWLESNALLPEEGEEEDHYNFPDDQLPELPPAPSPRFSVPSPADIEESRKRLRSKEDSAEEDKRRRKTPETEVEEEWLRYSPPPESPRNPAPDHIEEKILSRFASEIQGECMPVTGSTGDRIYAKLSRWEDDRNTKRGRFEVPASGLLSESINVLMERVEQEAFTKALQATSETPYNEARPAMPTISEKLWVDKYAPSSFTDLLSDEQTNREVLLWLKQWDSCVFGSQIKATTDDVLSALRRHSSSISQQKKSSEGNNFSMKRGMALNRQNKDWPNSFHKKSDSTRSISESWTKLFKESASPDQKVLLLCGPPGLGKTTLAHVAAKHCGYRVVEINASDDRSMSSIESKVLDAVEMNSVFSDSKPKCLIIDEIDGALSEGKGAVEVILKMLARGKKSFGKENHSQNVEHGKSSTKKQPKATTLSRPIICICNDLFAPALRQLRQLARVHKFAHPTVSRVVNRLKYICNKEGLKTSSIALTALAEYTECDIRSCLNTLQFLYRKKEDLNISKLGSQVVGRKDMSRSAFDVWKEIFLKRKVKHEWSSMNASGSAARDFDFLYSLITNRGDYELTMDGIHENFLKGRYHDPLMQKTVKCLNVLGLSDSFINYIMRNQQMSLYMYQPCMAITIRSLVSQVEKPNIEWPKSFQRHRASFIEKKELLKFWHNKISPSLSRHLSIESYVEDVISPLLKILSPPNLRPVALQLLTEREKNDLSQLIDTMLSYALTYKNLKPETYPGIQIHDAAPDASSLSFDPPIHDFVNYKGYISADCGLSLAVKQVVVHEVEKKKILRESMGKPALPSCGNGSVVVDESLLGRAEAYAQETSAGMANSAISLQNLNVNCFGHSDVSAKLTVSNKNASIVGVKSKAAGGLKEKSGGSSSFFDRFRKTTKKGSQETQDDSPKPPTSERDVRPLLFKFNEGFTNAVKRPVRMSELL